MQTSVNEWSTSDEFLESIFSSDLLKDLDGPDLFPINDINRNNIINNNIIINNSSSNSNSDDDKLPSIGFNDMDCDDLEQHLMNHQSIISSNSSDSGLSSDHLDL